MTGKADFTAEEWELLTKAPPGAGLIVSTAQRGGSFRESFSVAKAYAEARQQHGESELLDEVVSGRPKVDSSHRGSVEEMKQRGLQSLRDAIALLEQKATPEEVEDYRRFVLSVAERVAGAKEEEGGEAVSEAERATIAEIGRALAGEQPPS